MALPSYVLMSVSLTIVLATAYLLDCTLLTNEVFFASFDHFVAQVALTVDKATIERL